MAIEDIDNNRSGTTIKEKIKLLEVSDIFYAVSRSGANLICIVTGVDKRKIYARRITTQEKCSFDRETGVADSVAGKSEAFITSVAPLPIDIHQQMVGLDRRYRLGGKSLEDARLSDDERKALLFIDEFYSTGPLDSGAPE